jgi:D-3-phosphoglycerate dehydrogenase
MKKNILICERFALEAQLSLKNNKNFNVEKYSDENSTSADALIIRSQFKITEDVLKKSPNLKLILTCTSGFDHIDLKATEQNKITVMFTPEANATSAAELTWTLLMAANRKVAAANKELKSGVWTRNNYLSNELAHKTLGLVGLGRIGSKVAQFAKAFSMNVMAFDPYVEPAAFENCEAERVSYEEILKRCDFLSFHVPATKETTNMFNRSHYEYTSPEMILINTSRGQVINEDDLALALNENKIRFAALDVFQKEPLSPESKLLKCQNILLTPHLGAYTEEAFLKASHEAALRVTDFFENNKTRNTLPLMNDWGRLSFTERS